MAFDASPSWSGFNYQGKVALYYALVLINKETTDADLSAYSLMLESTEDFEIKKNDKSVSIHQVKAYNKSTFEKYSNALIEITLELYKQPTVYGFVHTWKAINNRPSFTTLTDSIKNDLTLICNEYKDSTDKVDTTIGKAASDSKKITKTSAILRYAFPTKSADDLYTILMEVLTGKNDALSRVESYEYDDKKKYCDLDDINKKIKNQITLAFQARKKIITDDHLDKTFHHYLGMIDRHIIGRHKTIADAKKISISINTLILVLETDLEDISKDYLSSKFKERFSYQIDQYMGDELDYPDIGDDQPCNLQAACAILLALHPRDLWEHYRSFSPHLLLDDSSNTNNAFTYNDEGIRLYLLKILHTVDIAKSEHNATRHQFTYRSKTPPLQNYLPTTITNNGRLDLTSKQMHSNPCLSEVLYEIENLIHCGETEHIFYPDAEKNTEAPMETDADQRLKRTETFKSISIIPLQKAKIELAK
ncbi:MULTISPECIES: ABC-three component system protein [unclassified Pseudomonas]|uniref:ABC-three component system protein n=1 Tax=unclassified Pseudomonas TaxID=196821 RepID=UPI000A1F0716|nr:MULTISPECIES: ABC-three component system protein [unclassified Pseudomonas]